MRKANEEDRGEKKRLFDWTHCIIVFFSLIRRLRIAGTASRSCRVMINVAIIQIAFLGRTEESLFFSKRIREDIH
ncbi:MAG: hypothetical protein D3924_05175 [Candidatus Electrothrix sp. AR4]|nr:hypothetical protein [Candidatus Electrothrix sp. AR4]